MFTYRIAQKWNNPINYTINNTAYIYFDNNPPIITNTVFHNIKDNFPTAIAENTAFKGTLNTIAYPNPAEQNITLQLSSLKAGERYTVEVYTTNGQLVKSMAAQTQLVNAIDIGNLTTGLYTYRILTTNANTAAGRFVKE